jgi:hypothetical protein
MQIMKLMAWEEGRISMGNPPPVTLTATLPPTTTSGTVRLMAGMDGEPFSVALTPPSETEFDVVEEYILSVAELGAARYASFVGPDVAVAADTSTFAETAWLPVTAVVCAVTLAFTGAKVAAWV